MCASWSPSDFLKSAGHLACCGDLMKGLACPVGMGKEEGPGGLVFLAFRACFFMPLREGPLGVGFVVVDSGNEIVSEGFRGIWEGGEDRPRASRLASFLEALMAVFSARLTLFPLPLPIVR